MKYKNLIKYTIIISLLTWLILFIPYQEHIIIKTLRIIFGSIFILFMPWYYLTLSFFKKKEIDFLERFALSFALSISVIPLLSFYLNLVWVKINSLSVYIITLSIIILNIIYLNFKKSKKQIWKKVS